MYISVDGNTLKVCLAYTAAAAFTAFFGGVYELFSHQVYSPFMIYAFAIPLGLGAVPSLLLAVRGRKVPSVWGKRLYRWGVAALTVGSVFRGVLEIYGTTNRLAAVYPAVGLPLLAAGVLLCAAQASRSK